MKSKPLFISAVVILSITAIVLGILLWNCYRNPTNESFTERPRVVVSFTMTPGRVQFLSEMADEISKQSFQPDAVYACIPVESKRFKEDYIVDPDNIPDGITVVRCQDYGPATKLLGSLHMEQDPNTIIITLDDDQHNKKDLLRNLVEAALSDNNTRVGTRAKPKDFSANPYKIIGARREETGNHMVLEGCGGIAYRRGMITPEIMGYFQELTPDDPCWKSDDVTFDRLLEAQGVNTRKIRTQRVGTNMKADSVSPLRLDSRKKMYEQCLVNLESYMQRNMA